MSFGFDVYVIEFPFNIHYNIFDEGYCAGISFETENGFYELIHNRDADWNRIFIKYKNKAWVDVPFNESSCGLLPEGVSVYKYEH